MRVLITGMAGFIGSHIADVMVERGHEVIGVDALLPKAHGDAGAPEWTRRHRMVIGDVRDGELLRELLADVDVVCHQAAVVGHGIDPSDAPSYAEHNDVGTAVLLAAMHEVGLRRLVLASSMVVYGEGRYACAEHGSSRPEHAASPTWTLASSSRPARCAACRWPGNWYPRTLRWSRAAVTRRARSRRSTTQRRGRGRPAGSVWALRYHNVYGARMPRDTPYAGVASLFRSALQRGEAPLVLEDGGQQRDFVHVTDVALINALAAETEAAAGMLVPVNVCSGVPHTVGELAVELAKACDGPAPKIVGGARPTDVRHVVADPRERGSCSGSPRGSGSLRASPRSRRTRCANPRSSETERRRVSALMRVRVLTQTVASGSRTSNRQPGP